MSLFVVKHLLESTFVCLLLSAVACCLKRGATARHAVLLLGVLKFAVPTVLLSHTGEQLAALWPATPWVSLVTFRVSAIFAAIQQSFPAGRAMTFCLVWAVGTAVLFVLWLFWLRGGRVSLLQPSEREQATLVRIQECLGMRRRVRLRCTAADLEPALHGVWRPMITIPQGLMDKLSAVEFEGVLLHELAHARRFDNLTSVFVHAVVCLFWFHPLLWIVERRLFVERERACDEAVIASGMNPGDYAAALLKVCQFHLSPVAPGVSGASGGDLRERFERILNGPAVGTLLYVPWLLVTFLAILMTLVPVAGGYCGQCAQSASDSAAAFKCNTPANCLPAGKFVQ